MAPAHSQGERFDPRRGRKRYLQRSSAKGCSVVFKQLVIRPFWADFDLRAGHLFTKQLLGHLSYAGHEVAAQAAAGHHNAEHPAESLLHLTGLSGQLSQDH